jgi:hypothetical protein
MKKCLMLLLAFAGLFFLIPTKADAGVSVVVSPGYYGSYYPAYSYYYPGYYYNYWNYNPYWYGGWYGPYWNNYGYWHGYRGHWHGGGHWRGGGHWHR